MDTYDDNPWHDEEFNIKPIRLAKRRTSLPPPAPSLESSSPDEFKMRPIRLTSRTTNNDKKSFEDDHRPRNSKDLSPIISPNTPRRRSIQIKNLPVISSSPPKLRIDKNSNDFIFAICLVDFHHIRGPEIEWWKSNYVPELDASLFKNLPFQSLPDGSHLFEETFSNFNLVYDFSTNKSYDNLNDLINFNDDPRNLQTLFGCACVRQININELSPEELERNKDIKRSIVQKALVIINRNKPIFTKIKDKLSIITRSYFLQENLSNYEVLDNLFNNLNHEINFDDNEEFFINLNLKQSLLQLRSNFLTIFKALLLEKKVLIYSNNKLELLTKFQNNLISLIPNLINNLVYSGCQLSDYQENFTGKLMQPVSLNTENRDSMLNFFGLPLKLFNTKGSFWNPYLPLQQINQLNFPETKSFMIGCSNLLFVNQSRDLGIDLLINLDTYELTFPNGMDSDLVLSSFDKSFINNVINNCSNDKVVVENENFVGSDDYIRYQFEDYILSFVSTVRFNQYLDKFNQYPPGFTNSPNADANEDNNPYNGDLSAFNLAFVDEWKKSHNFEIWDLTCDEFVFNFVTPRHVSVDSTNTSALTNFFSNLNFKFIKNDEPDSEVKPNKFIEKLRVAPEQGHKPKKSSSDEKWNFFKRSSH
ncbi:hypothetical protein PSN45_002048 [Yamadazyma tenuis]|uniref:UDENN domain-containing protein n=1 Tax=Candida tenuis (strain ATCC 10573 / BCRC 21748 / CBS 615 / JCM 9827 / NBRC 10315 / NRRL Y-1498 / VKM Y-70) TaxID=590646 RepID=G3BCM7_CANTC|nr:uncharacterized protein CANTEDRAFT_110107 [Yamadazyma tenuis ATCC 10573]EGV60203.1 hypothetical protein CANTEDRAFT_110107 [Yamadazyma tenuis ATCC 10573]WEJ94557.1 hypothetical protein PSN45_002048 [Yamadazyma tenuis]